MRIVTTRFGELDVPDDYVYRFPEGILGFSGIELYFVLNNPKGGPFQWLQAVTPTSLAFVVCDPTVFMPDYKVRVRPEDLASIDLKDIAAGFVLVILTVPRDPKEITANLQGPLVFNPEKRLAKQIVLNDPAFTTRHRIFAPSAATPSGASPGAGAGAS
ncbi:MAG: flagellar assembly protein FliW [Planctomycetes bacterium]|nr:flagellar assembly protein FliW [Planctomycetota bacterium]